MEPTWQTCVVALAAAALLGAAGSSPPSYRIETMAGSSNLGDGGPATAAQFGVVKGVAADAWGNLFVADTDHHRVRRISPAGIVSTLAGTGTAGFSGDGGPAAAAQLNLPYGLAVDLAGYVYVADLGNSRVRRIAPDGTISTFAGNGTAGSGGDGGAATDARLMQPRNVAADSIGNLYISEFGAHRVRRVTPDGRIATVAGTGLPGFNGDGPAGSVLLNSPAGLALDSTGALLIADSANNRIRRLSQGTLTTIGGPWTGSTPVAVAADLSGTVYMSDTGPYLDSHAVNAGNQWARFAGTGGNGFAGDGGPAAQALLSAAWDVAADVQGNVYVADGVRVRRIDRWGIIRTVAGDGYLQAVGDGLAATSALLFQPWGVALDGFANLYIADTGTNRVRQVGPSGTIRTFAGTGLAGPGPDQTSATRSNLYSPMSVAPGPSGTLYIADTNNHRVRAVDGNGLISTVAGTGVAGRGAEGLPAAQMNLRAPRGVCLDRAGTLYIVDTGNHRVLRVLPGATQIAAGNGSPGDAGDGGAAALAQLNMPGACTLDTAGNLFVADTGSHRIRKVTPAGGITTVAGTGVAGSAGDEGPATAAQLNAPAGIAVEDDGNLFVADTQNHRIRQVTPDGVIPTVAGQGSPGFSGAGGPAASAQLYGPAGLVLDGAGDLYFADSGNNRVRRLVPQPAAPPVTPPDPVIAPPTLAARNAASLAQGPAAPGEILVVFGNGLGPDTGVAAAPDASGMLPTLLAGAEVRFDGIPGPVLYAQYGQINVQAPYAIAGNAATHFEVLYQGKSAGTENLGVVAANPAMYAVVVNQDGSLNAETNPALRGTVVAFFATGEGLTDGGNVSGMAAQAPYGRPRQAVALAMGGISADLLYAGAAPGQVGELQVNARVPGGFLPTGQVAVQLTVGVFNAPVMMIWVK
jgi:uncharacterized protein (TIGR03437 family)